MMTILLMPLFLESIMWSFGVVLRPLSLWIKSISPVAYLQGVICSSVFLTFSSRIFLEFCGEVRLSLSSSYTNQVT